MKAKVMQMTKDVLMVGLRKVGFDVLKASLKIPNGGLFSSPDDRVEAFKKACSILELLQGNVKNGRSHLPSTPTEIERYLDILLADMSFMDAYGWINSRFANRSNTELVKEAREAIECLKRLGGDAAEKASNLEWTLKRRIGEE